MKKTKDTAPKKGQMTHWKVTDIEFNDEGGIVISDPKMAAVLKKQIKQGKHIYLTSTNSGNYCVVISHC